MTWWWQVALMSAGITMIVVAWHGLRAEFEEAADQPGNTLRRSDVLPTSALGRTAPLRQIVFPAVGLSAPIIPAIRTFDSWETRYLGDSVGHLQGTAWLDSPGGNIVLAGHVETNLGEPGPFAHLERAQENDVIMLHEGGRTANYRVIRVIHAQPDEVQLVAQDGRPRLTLITCADWDRTRREYRGRLAVIAEPAPITALR